MVVAADNILLTLTVIAATLFLVLGGRAKGQQMRLVLGGLGVAAAMAALALLGDALLGPGSP
jgi:uncharacterized membrane protein